MRCWFCIFCARLQACARTRPPRLDLENYPHLPPAQVQTTQAADYMALLREVKR